MKLKRIIRWCDKVSRAGGILSGILIIAGFTLILMEIVVRTFFHKTLYITEEYSGYLMAALSFLALSYTLHDKGHIRMTFLHSVLKGKGRKILGLYAYAMGFAFCTVLTWATFRFFWDSLVHQSRSMQVSETYLAFPHAFLPIGAFLLALQFAVEFLTALSAEDDADQESKALGR